MHFAANLAVEQEVEVAAIMIVCFILHVSNVHQHTEPCERLLPPKKIQMGPFNISKHLGSCVLFRASCKLPP